MTGTLPSIPLAQNFDENGLPQSGCRLFVYEANTSTQVITYKDLLMSTGMEHSWPIVADALGRIPMFFVPDGYYRARLEDRYGTPLYDEAVLPALSTGEGGGGPGAPAAVQWSTGDFLWQPVAGVKEGWVRANTRSIGNALSGASERANADCANLFAFLWNNFSQTICPVAGGRGASATADFDANRVIHTLDMRGLAAAGLDGMGNTLRGIIAGPVPIHTVGGGADVPGSLVGANAQVMTTSEMPSHDHAATTNVSVSLADPGHSHTYWRSDYISSEHNESGGALRFFNAENLDSTEHKTTGIYISAASGSTTITPRGGNAAQNNITLSILGTWYIRI